MQPTGKVHFCSGCCATVGLRNPVCSEHGQRAREAECAGVAGEHPQGWGVQRGGKDKKKQGQRKQVYHLSAERWGSATRGFLSHDSKSHWAAPCSREL